MSNNIRNKQGMIAGYASYFNIVDRMRDRVAKGAFKATLRAAKMMGKMPRMLWQHDPKQPIGVWTRLFEDDRGLFAEGKLVLGVPKADEAYLLLQQGAIDGLSIGFRTIQASHDKGGKTRTLLDIDLIEISLVTFGANACATAHVISDQ
jgi:HK97 family phage prohead protease